MVDTMQKVVLVTGASSGIGKACAEHLAARGFQRATIRQAVDGGRVAGLQAYRPFQVSGRGGLPSPPLPRHSAAGSIPLLA